MTTDNQISIFDELHYAATIVDVAVELIKHNQSDEACDKSRQPYLQRIQQTIAAIGQSLVLKRIKHALGLNQQQLAVLMLVLLPNHKLNYRQTYAQLNGDNQQPYPTLHLIINLLCFSLREQNKLLRQFIENDPLIHWRFLILPEYQRDLMAGPISMPSDLICFLLGIADNDKECHRCIHPLPMPEHAIVPHPAMLQARLSRLVALRGKRGCGRKTQAHYYSRNNALYCFDWERFKQFDDKQNTFKDMLRYVLLKRANAYFPEGLEALKSIPGLMDIMAQWLALKILPEQDIEHDNYESSLCGILIFAELDQEVDGETQSALQQQLSCDYHGDWPSALLPFSPLTVRLFQVDEQNKLQLWQNFVRSYLPHYTHLTEINWQLINARFPLPARNMLQVCQRIRARYPVDHVFCEEDIFELCRSLMKTSLANLAVCDTPTDSIEDMVLATSTREQLEEVILHGQLSSQLIALGVKKTRSVQSLFWGPSGTGKTMAAGAVANKLQRPLYKVDLSNIASKWIGETEKHLAYLFDEAEQNHGILFFDEADSVFGKRSAIESSHDKNANMGVSYLLQRMETYQGMLILATNFKGNLDNAFLRRLQLSVEFPFPAPPERLLLWQQVWSEALPVSAEVDLPSLADLFELTGANIKNVGVHASLLALNDKASEIKAEHVAASIRREFQKLDNGYRAEAQIERWLQTA